MEAFWTTLPEAAKACPELLKCGCKQVLADVNVSKLIYLVQIYVRVLGNAITLTLDCFVLELRTLTLWTEIERQCI